MDLTCRFHRSPLLFHRHIGNFCWKASWMTLCLVFVERSVILPPQHFRSSQFTEDFIAAFFLEDLFNRLWFRHPVDPFFSPKLLFKALRCEGTFGQIIHFISMANPQIGEGRVDRNGYVASKRPRRGGPDKQIFAWAPSQRKTHKHRPVSDSLITFMHFHLANTDGAAGTPRH